jgi:MioC protein
LSAPITILVGTMTGTAEMVAADVKAALEGEGHQAEILVMDNLLADVFERPGAILVITSTYGQGDVPDNARALFDDMKAKRPNLAGRPFGVIGLGDSTYADTYNHGGQQFDDLLADLGATRTKERMAHNASGDQMPETMAVAWALDWVKTLSAPVAA